MRRTGRAALARMDSLVVLEREANKYARYADRLQADLLDLNKRLVEARRNAEEARTAAENLRQAQQWDGTERRNTPHLAVVAS